MLSKGHAAPILYAAWAEAGAFDRAELLKLRQIGSDLEGHPTPRLPFVDVATGSLGQGICAAIGIALNARRIGVRLPHLRAARRRRVGRRFGLGSGRRRRHRRARQPVRHHRRQRASARAARRCGSTTWSSSRAAGARSAGTPSSSTATTCRRSSTRSPRRARTKGQPTMILARTIKGKGVSFVEGKDGWHGKAFKKGEELDRALAELEQQFVPAPPAPSTSRAQIPKPARRAAAVAAPEAGRAAGLQARRPGRDARGLRRRAGQARRRRRRASSRSTPT